MKPDTFHHILVLLKIWGSIRRIKCGSKNQTTDLVGGAILHLLSLVEMMDPDEGCDAVVNQHNPLCLD